MKSNHRIKHFLILIAIFISLCSASEVKGQRNVRSEGTSQVRVEGNMTKDEALLKAIELAKINAIENAYGTYIEQQATLTVESGTSDFYIVGNTKVKGIWVRTLDGPEIKQEYRDEAGQYGADKVLWITCHIKGEIKRVKPRPTIEYQVRNCKFPTCRTTSFLSGEQLFLWFKSPVSGYLSVFIDDGNMVYRLLPYSNVNDQSSYEVTGDENYLFFSPESHKGVNPADKPDEIELYTLKRSEYNTLILVFSTDPYFKPGLNPERIDAAKNILPKSITKSRFESWLSEHRAQFDDFLDLSIPIEIKNL